VGNLFGLVLDCSSLVPCGEKSEEMKEAIRQLGSKLYNLNCVIIYFSPHLIKVYYTIIPKELKNHHPLPPFQANLLRLLPELVKITSKSRGLLCNVRQTEGGVKFHILETSRVEYYDVNDVGLIEEEDKEVLRIALAIASKHEKVFLVTADRHFLESVNQNKLLRRYHSESQKIKIVAPNDPNFMNFLTTQCKNNAST
jgi:hypothetical protein